jgi:hypothetical protein
MKTLKPISTMEQKNKTKVASILIQQSVLDTKQVACHEHAARSPGIYKNDTEVEKNH